MIPLAHHVLYNARIWEDNEWAFDSILLAPTGLLT